MPTAILARLGTMMFLEFFVWGAWYATLGLVLARHHLAGTIGDAFSVGPIASIVSPLVLGLISDRFLSSQRVLAVMHILGAALLYAAPSRLAAGDGHGLLAVLFLYMLCYMPTVALTNNVAFHALRGAEGRFPLVRVFGTVGWVVAGVAIGELGLSDSSHVFELAAAGSLLLGLYSFTLPDTPAAGKSGGFAWRDILFADAVLLLKQPHFLVFCICAGLISIPLATYYAFAAPFLDAAGIGNVGTVMSFGQVSEIGCMLLIPLLFRRLGVKGMLLVGMLAWALRYLLFALAVPEATRWMLYLGVILHGVCYDFFFVVGFMYTDQVAGERVKSQAQSLVVTVTYGLGMLIGSQLAGAAFNRTVGAAAALSNWQSFWWLPAGAALAVAILFTLSFRYRAAQTARAS
jgi:nucleoside transporter